ncbi:MAG: hypothetical protein AVDCRST_MAG19-4101, partial [uncultured Thermomicrobiales bacterium]
SRSAATAFWRSTLRSPSVRPCCPRRCRSTSRRSRFPRRR